MSPMMRVLGVLVFLSATFIFNAYKLVIISRLRSGEHYMVFPCGYKGVNCTDPQPFSYFTIHQKSSSDSWWLMAHVLTALIDITLSGLVIIFPQNEWIIDVVDTSHKIFLVLVSFNLHHFGEFKPFWSVLVNGGLFVAAVFFMIRDNHKSYFITLALAPGFEMLLMGLRRVEGALYIAGYFCGL